MTKIDLDIEKLIKEAIIENFDMDRFVDAISSDIYNCNPEWWVELIVKPLKDVLLKAILENKDIVREVIEEILDRECAYDKVEAILKQEAEDRISWIMPKVSVKFEENKDE